MSSSQVFSPLAPCYLVEMVNTRSGVPTLRVTLSDGRSAWLHSRYDPVRESEELAERWIMECRSADLVVVLGLGLGYHVESLARRLGSQSLLVVIEANEPVYHSARHSPQLRNLQRLDNVRVCAAHKPIDVYKELGQYFNPLRHRKVVFLEHGPSVRLSPHVYAKIREEIRAVFQVAPQDVATRIAWSETWPKNSLENIRALVTSPGVASLANRFAGIPGIVVSAGPSLERSLPTLHRAKGRALIAAVGTSLRPLLDAGVRPDLVVSIDGGDANWKHFDGLSYSDIPLVMAPILYPAIVRNHHGVKFVADVGSSVLRWLRPLVGDKGHLGTGGSVANTTLHLLYLLGCDPIIFVGQDLAYTNGYSHSRGTALNKAVDLTDPRLLKVPGNNGNEVLTSRSMLSFLKWNESFIARFNDRRYINATEGGARIAGTEILPLESVVTHVLQGQVNVDSILQDVYARYTPADIQTVVRYLKEGADELDKLRRIALKGTRRAQRLQELAKRSSLESNEIDKIVRALDRIDKEIRDLDDWVLPLLDGPLSAVTVATLRGDSAQHNADGNFQDETEQVARRSSRIYAGLAVAARDMSTWIRQAAAQLEDEPQSDSLPG